MDGTGLPAQILLYIAGATTITNILVNGIRNSVVLPAIVAFGLAILFGIGFMLLFMVANSIPLTPALVAGAAIAGVLVAGASAGANATHNNTLPTSQKTP